MAQPVKTVVMTDELKSAALSRFDQLQQEIRKRAFERYCMRNGRGADPLEDWLAAEREIVNPSLLVSSDCEDQVQITAAAPGFEAKQLAVDVFPDAIVIEGEATGARSGRIDAKPNTRRKIFNRVPLQCPVDASKVKAYLDGDQLIIVAPKKASHATQGARPAHAA